MKKVVLLYHPRTLHENAYRYFYIPYSLLSISTLINRSNTEIIIIDANLSEPTREEIGHIFSSRDVLCVGISSMIGHQIAGGIEFSKMVKLFSPTTPIIWGGAAATLLPDLLLSSPFIDLVVSGQGQITFSEIINALIARSDYKSVKGIHYVDQGKIISTMPRPFVNWASLPGFKDVFDLVHVEDYIRNDEHINSKTINYHSSQGCSFSCGFCSEVALWDQRWGGFNPENIFLEIKYLVDKYSVNGIKFHDAEFFINRKRSIKFSEALIEAGLSIKWAAAIHPRNFERLTDLEVSKLGQSGLSRLLMGAESGVQSELDLVGKNTTPEMIVRMAKRCSEFGIVGCFSFVTGYPGFPLEHIWQTMDFAKQLRDIDDRHECKVHLYGPYPGTPLFQRSIDYGFTPPTSLDEWSFFDYYEATTPWIPKWVQEDIRAFNEANYIYMSHHDKLNQVKGE